MKRVITSLSLLLLLLCGAQAQSITQYEYWTDDDYASRTTVSSSGGDISLSINTASLAAGVHFLNFRACRDDGVWGNFYRYLYYIPTLKNPVTGSVNVEYWLDDNRSGAKTASVSGSSLSLTIDISSLTPGVHYLNCIPINAQGEYGSPVREMFYIPDSQSYADAQLASYEYWIDDNYAERVTSNSSSTEQEFTIDVSQLSGGVHYFNYWPSDNKGRRGNITRQMFYLARTVDTSTSDKIDYEYWIDSDTDNKVTGSGAPGVLVFNVNVATLSMGSHTFNFRAMNLLEQWGPTFTETFVLSTEPIEIITITAQDASMVYGDNVPQLTYNVTGGTMVGEPSLSTTATNTSSVGTYPITVSRGTVTNANVNFVNGKLTVTKAPLKASVGSYTRTQGEANPVFEILYEGWKNNDTESVLIKKPTATTTAVENSAPGSYVIVVSGGEAQNYTFSYENGVLIVTEATDVRALIASGKSFDIYTTAGIKVRSQATDFNGLQKGVYVVNGKKVVVQ